MKAREEVYYEFWIRADSHDDAGLAVLNLEGDQLEQNIIDAEGFEIYDESEFEEEELYGWVKNKIIEAKDVLNE
jgi:hypothetical protein